MTNDELRDIAIKLSGRKARKNAAGIGAYRWLADKLEVHPSTIARWIRGKDNNGSDVPKWAVDEINRLLSTTTTQT